jgi:DNA-binding response OmpR family regulator
LRVLIVDNNADVAETLKYAIEIYCGATATCAETGAAAVRALRTEVLDVAVIDPGLPDMSGFELAERAADSNVPVLLVSGHPGRQEICQSYKYPWLAKPFSLSELGAAVTDISNASSQNIARIHNAYAHLRANLERANRLTVAASRIANESQKIKSDSVAAREARKRREP